jgi:hypothetical protein
MICPSRNFEIIELFAWLPNKSPQFRCWGISPLELDLWDYYNNPASRYMGLLTFATSVALDILFSQLRC